MTNMKKWGYTDDDNVYCDCGKSPKSMQHLLRCPTLGEQCCREDLMAADQKVVSCAQTWQNVW